MHFRTEEGLEFWAYPLQRFTFQIAEETYQFAILTTLDDEDYVVGTSNTPEDCKGKARRFVGKFKLPIKVIKVERTSDDRLEYTDQYTYNLEAYNKWKIRKKRLAAEQEFLQKKIEWK